jgi:hypothetical protein
MDDRIIFWNARSLLTNLSEFKVYLYCVKPAIVFISETWLKFRNTLTFVNYNQVRLDRQNRCGGGILFLIRKDVLYNCIPLTAFPNGNMEVLGILVTFHNFCCAILGIYNPASTLFSSVELDHFVLQLQASELLLLGDFNAKHSSWSTGRVNAAGRALFSFINTSPSLCLLTPPNLTTHLDVSSGHTSTLDLCIGSATFLPQISCSTGPDIGSDHLPVVILFKNLFAPTVKSIFRRRWIIPGSTDFSAYQHSVNSYIRSPTPILFFFVFFYSLRCI